MDSLYDTLQSVVVDYCEPLPYIIPKMRKPPPALEFLKKYVMTSTPFVIQPYYYDDPLFDAVLFWKKKEFLRRWMGFSEVTVAVTPDGRADSVVNDLFMLPEERKMKFNDFLDKLEHPDPNEVFYLQRQNNNLFEEFSAVIHNVKPEVSWASEALGSLPDAVNIWIGDNRSISSYHKDHYENIYFVIVGKKIVTLYPPIAVGWMPYKKYKKYQWYYESNEWKMKDLNEQIKWIPRKIEPQAKEKYLMYSNTRSYHVILPAGQALYIPAMWYHEVRQSEFTIAVNYWYDMKYDVKYPFLRLFNKLCKLPYVRKDASVDRQSELEDSLRVELMEAFKKRERMFVPKRIAK